MPADCGGRRYDRAKNAKQRFRTLCFKAQDLVKLLARNIPMDKAVKKIIDDIQCVFL